MSAVIKVQNIWKQYRLGQVGTGTIADDITRWLANVRGKEDPFINLGDTNEQNKTGNSRYVWALNNINFEVKQGEIIGIIGKNGAGKSTLLKLLSKITSPTKGEITITGRLASLLEVGTGFHPDLTGRENTFLNGAILGMTKKEVKTKFDEIVAFSGIERYIDSPVKRYSSGMYVRLAFAVAAHLEPEILIIDEVLAVGDAEFQKKCLGKLQDVANEGRTVIFVSHNLAAIKTLCSRCIVLTNGHISYEGDVDISVVNYLKADGFGGLKEYKVFDGQSSISIPECDLLSVGVKAKEKHFGDPIRMDEEVELVIKYKKKIRNCTLDVTIQVKDSSGNYLFVCSSARSTIESNMGRIGVYEYTLEIDSNFFNPDTFYINLLVVKDKKTTCLRQEDVIFFHILDKERVLGEWMGKSAAPLFLNFPWRADSKN